MPRAPRTRSHYSQAVWRRWTQAIRETARRLSLDRRTVKSKIDEDFLGRLRI
jgi:ActR/RegA family two-component response regulator